MNSPYQEEPLFDPVIKTLTPICVFGMLASLTYFMIDLRAAIMPEGVGFMKYILFFFILAAVGLNRIRTEQEEHGCSWVVLSVALALVTLSVLTARAGTMGAFTGQRMGVPLALLINVVIVATIRALKMHSGKFKVCQRRCSSACHGCCCRMPQRR